MAGQATLRTSKPVRRPGSAAWKTASRSAYLLYEVTERNCNFADMN